MLVRALALLFALSLVGAVIWRLSAHDERSTTRADDVAPRSSKRAATPARTKSGAAGPVSANVEPASSTRSSSEDDPERTKLQHALTRLGSPPAGAADQVEAEPMLTEAELDRPRSPAAIPSLTPEERSAQQAKLVQSQLKFFDEQIDGIADKIQIAPDHQASLRELFSAQAAEVAAIVAGEPLESEVRQQRLSEIRWRYTDQVRELLPTDQYSVYFAASQHLGIFGLSEREEP